MRSYPSILTILTVIVSIFLVGNVSQIATCRTDTSRTWLFEFLTKNEKFCNVATDYSNVCFYLHLIHNILMKLSNANLNVLNFPSAG